MPIASFAKDKSIKESEKRYQLIRIPRPKPDESLLGYVVSLTEANTYDHPRWILSLLNELNIEKNSNCRTELSPGCAAIADVAGLSRLTSVDADFLNGMRIHSVDRSSQNKRNFNLFDQKIPRYFTTSHYKVCPECLQEASYIRKIWHVAAVTACPFHGRLLLDNCPKCGKRFTYHRSKISECLCKYDLRRAAEQTNECDAAFSRHIYECCGLMDRSNETYIDSPFHNFDLEGLLISVNLLSSQLYNLTNSQNNMQAFSKPASELHEILNQGYSALLNWPKNYYKYLDTIRSNNRDRQVNAGLIQDFKKYFASLRKLKENKYDFLKKALEEYVGSKWDSGYVGDGDLLRKMLPYAGYISANEAANLLGTKCQTIIQLVKAGLIRGQVFKVASRQLSLVKIASVEELKQKYDEALTLKEAAKMLGTYRVNVVDMAKNKSLKALRGPTVEGGTLWAFQKEAIDDLINRICKNMNGECSRKSQAANNGLCTQIPFQKAVMRLGKYLSMKTASFVAAILKGELSACKKKSGRGLASFVFCKKQLDSYIQNKNIILNVNSLLLNDASTRLKIGYNYVHELINKGFLKVVDKSQSTIIRITKESIDEFENQYVSTLLLAYKQKLHHTQILKILFNNGIWPVTGPMVDNGRLILFKKSDVDTMGKAWFCVEEQKLSMAELTKKIKYLNKNTAARALGIKSQELQRLVNKCVLAPSWRSQSTKHMRRTYYIASSDIEYYKKQQCDLSGLLSPTEAAKIMGISKQWFFHKWAGRGRFEKVIVPYSNEKYFIKVSEVKKVITARQLCINSFDANRMLGTNSHILFDWRRNGTINPVSGPSVDGSGQYLYLRADIETLKRNLSTETKGFLKRSDEEGI